MQNVTKKLLAITLLLSFVPMQADADADDSATSGLSYFLPRAQNGTAVDVFGWEESIHKYDADTFYFDFKTQSEFRQSFNSTGLGQYIFFNGTNSMNFGPAQPTDTDTDVFSMNFLLPVGFESVVTAKPKVQSSITDFSFFVGLDEWCPGLYVSAHLPLVWTRWNAHLTEVNVTECPTTYAAGDVQAAAGLATSYTNVVDAFKGNSTVTTAPIWTYGVINGSQSKTRLGDVAVNLGYDFISKENAHLGVAVRGLFGAGGKSKANYVFEPTIGMAGRMGVGGMIDGHVRLWEKDEDHHICAFLNGYAVHVFDNTQVRSFDLTASGVGSRYNLVKRLTTIAAASANNVYGNLDNMINIGTQGAKISIGAAYEVTLQFSYIANKINFDFGYTGGGHSKEKFSSFADADAIPANTYLLYNINGGDILTLATSSLGSSEVFVNGNASGATTAAVQVSTEDTYCIDNDWLDTDSALAPSTFASCFYANLGYTWKNNDWQPNVSIFTNVEFGGGNKTLHTWGVGLQGNVSY